MFLATWLFSGGYTKVAQRCDVLAERVGETAAKGGCFRKRRSKLGVNQEYTKSAPFWETGSSAKDVLNHQRRHNALPPARPDRTNGRNFLEMDVGFQSLYPLAAVAAGYGLQEGAGKFLKSSGFQKLGDLAAAALSVPSAGSWL